MAQPFPNPKVIVEAVPNFSEGRDEEVIQAILDAATAPGVLLLDHSHDRDHNRMVVTVAGPPDAVLDGLFAAIRVAAERIDLFEHRGKHPRLGATDVVPLVPIRNISLAECVALAQRLGSRIGNELGLPVYLYEAAASQSQRRNLADVRRGEFERLLVEIDLPGRKPDYGPVHVGPAGAVIVGARPPLIAYNFFLKSDDLTLARSISRRIRSSSGGLPGVKAIGLLVDGQAQVSVNIVDHTQTGLFTLTESVKRLAEQQGSAVDRAELIGLLPQDALLDAAAQYLMLPDLSPKRILENALAAAEPNQA